MPVDSTKTGETINGSVMRSRMDFFFVFFGAGDVRPYLLPIRRKLLLCCGFFLHLRLGLCAKITTTATKKNKLKLPKKVVMSRAVRHSVN